MKLRQERDTLDVAESISKIAAAVLVPVVIAYFGWSYQSKLSETEKEIELVRMAIEVLSNPSPRKTDLDLEQWAKEVLNEKLPTPKNLETLKLEAQKYANSAFCIGSDHPLLERLGPIPKWEGRTYRDLAIYAVTLHYELERSHIYHNAVLDWIDASQEIQCSTKAR